MPALVVWERLLVAGDDLHFISILRICLYLVEIALVISITYYVNIFDHDRSIISEVVDIGCLQSEKSIDYFQQLARVLCIFTIISGIIAIFIAFAICKVSTRGTPTNTVPRRLLVPLCKCNMVPVFIVKVAVFSVVIAMTIITDNFCDCLQSRVIEKWTKSGCVVEQEWFVMVRIFSCLIAFDIFIPSILFMCILRSRTRRLIRNVRQQKVREAEDNHRWWQICCQRCCESMSLMTCYMFGGQRISSTRYADVAIFLTAFFEDRGALDIVPSDVAAALVCLMTIQRLKQIDCRNELMKEGGIYAKDKKFLGNVLSTFKSSLKGSDVDIETGLDKHCLEAASNEMNLQHNDENTINKDSQSEDSERNTSSSIGMTAAELEKVRELLKTSAVEETSPNFSFTAMHQLNGDIKFTPTFHRVLRDSDHHDRLVLAEGARYCRVALAAYSWMMYLWTSRCIGCCELSAHTLCDLCMRRPKYCHSRDHVIGDNLCGWKQTSVLKTLGIEERDFLFANFSNDVNVCPYIVLVDRRWRNILIVIRGTLSFEDMISDVTISPDPLDVVGEEFGFDGTGEYCHRGMLEAAMRINDDMEARRVLHKAMEDHPEFKLRIVGHSLGAGVASVLGLLMRKQFPLLKCLCFSPPGCVFTKRTAKISEDFALSYVLHNDLIPRLSYHSMVNLRNDVIEMVARIKVPKHDVFAKNMRFRSESKIQNLPAKLFHEPDKIPTSQFFSQFLRYLELQKERETEALQVRMTCPGKICQLYRTSGKLHNVPCNFLLSCIMCIPACLGFAPTKKYTARWMEAKDMNEIVISSSMMSDHFPYNVARALEVAAISCGVFDDRIDETANLNEEVVQEVEKKRC